MKQREQLELLTTHSQIKQVAQALKGEKMIALDTEFVRERTLYPKIALIQIATKTQVWLIDPVQLSKEDMQPLLDVLTDKSVLKLIHAAYADQEVLYWAYDTMAEPVLDTSVGAALSGFGDQRGLEGLVKDILDVGLRKGRARARWLQRPLSRELLDYAADDVAYLVQIGEHLSVQLNGLGRFDWAVEQSRVVPEDFDPTPEEITAKLVKGGFQNVQSEAILLELVIWREGRAHASNLPRPWVAANDTLISLAKSAPSSISQLKSFRGLKMPEVEKHGNKILEAIKRGQDTPSQKRPRNFTRSLTEMEKRIVDFVMTYVAFIAVNEKIATRFLMSSKFAPRVLQYYENPDIDWVESGILSGFANKVMGEGLKNLLSGDLTLGIKDQQLEVIVK